MLSKFSIKKPFTVLVAVIIIIVFGVISFAKMTPDLFPNINTPFVMVMTAYPGSSPEEAEKELTDPLEEQFATLPNIKNVLSISSANYSLVQLEFSDDVNMDAISIDIREKIDQIKGSFPERVATPVVMKINLDMMPIVTCAVSMENKSSQEVSTFVKENIENSLEGTEGVASVTSMGMTDDSIQVILSKEKIDEINKRISTAITAQMDGAKGEINKGLNEANKGKQDITKGKDSIKKGQQSATSKFQSAKKQLKDSRKQLEILKSKGPEIKALYDQYKIFKNDPIKGPQIIAAIKAAGFTPEELPKVIEKINNADKYINEIDKSISELDAQEAKTNFELGTKYSDLSVAESTIAATVIKLQSALAEIETSKEAAILSADMTGVLTMENISAILAAQNFSMPAGYVTDGKADILVSVGDKIQNKSELENLILFDMGIEGVDPIKLSDIADVTYGNGLAGTYAKINGNNGVLMSFTKQSSYPTSVVSENINDKFKELEKKNNGLKFTMLSDQGEYIHIVINSVLQSLILGALLAIIVLIIFLRDIRPTAITAVSIPLSVIFAVVLMYFSGVSLNMISLAGLAIGVGMLVDNSIVVIENIYRLRSMGYSKIQSALSGAVQVSGAITSSTLTTICVFVPIIFVEGMTKDIFVDLALTVAYSLLASLIIALTLVPAMAKGLLSKDVKSTMLSSDSRAILKYKSIIKWALYHKKTVLITAIILLIGSTTIALLRGFVFMPPMATPQISAQVQMPEDSTLHETAKVNDAIMEDVGKIDGVKTVGAMLSSDTMAMMGMEAAEQDVTNTMIYIVLEEDKAENGKIIAAHMDKLAKKYNCEIITSADMDMSQMTGTSGIGIKLYSDNLDLLQSTGASIEKQLNKMKSLEEISDVNEESSNELKITVDKNKAMKYGLTVAQVYQQISAKLADEKEATTLSTGGSGVDVVLNNNSSGISQNTLENIKLTVDKKDGSKEEVSLSLIADIERDVALDNISHDNQNRSLKVTAAVKDGYNITHVTDDVRKLIEEKNLVPKGVKIEYDGENEEIMEAMMQMILMMVVGFILVYLIMVAQFQSLRSPFIVIFTIPLAFTGGMLALLICNEDVSVVSMMGFVMLMGVVVNNAIVLVDCINRFRLEGMAMDDAVISAGAVRMRPVIMTAITTVLGLLPLAAGFGTGAEMMQPVAMVCIGGLIYATMTTLIVIPVMYKLLAKKHMQRINEEELEILNV